MIIVVIWVTCMTFFYGQFLFANSDLYENNYVHCFVEQGQAYPVPYGMEPTSDAINVSKWFMNLFLWGFIVQMFCIGAAFLGLASCIKTKRHEFVSITEVLAPLGQLSFLALLITYLIESCVQYIFVCAYRKTVEMKICSGDFQIEPDLNNYPYMINSGRFLLYLAHGFNIHV